MFGASVEVMDLYRELDGGRQTHGSSHSQTQHDRFRSPEQRQLERSRSKGEKYGSIDSHRSLALYCKEHIQRKKIYLYLQEVCIDCELLSMNASRQCIVACLIFLTGSPDTI